jgi:hypothetical protein
MEAETTKPFTHTALVEVAKGLKAVLARYVSLDCERIVWGRYLQTQPFAKDTSAVYACHEITVTTSVAYFS